MTNLFQNFLNILFGWFFERGWKVFVIALVALILQRISLAIIDKIVRKAVPSRGFSSKESEKKREDTLIKVFSNAVDILIWTTASMMALTEIGVNVGPLLAAAGIAGIALGFGGQYLIRDIISGLFIIFENQYRIGDIACLDQTCGLVENITLRMTTLRDLDGRVHHVPNGEIKRASNLSKTYARVNLNIGVSYSANLDKVISVVNKTGEELAQDPVWKENIISAPKFLRVDDFAESSVVIKILGDTKPLKQWDVTGELRKRIKQAFDKEGIEIPFPQRVVHVEKTAQAIDKVS